MSDVRTGPPGDRVTVSVQVSAPVDIAFSVFTEEIDVWWRRGLPYRVATAGVLRFEPGLGGRLYESIEPNQRFESSRRAASPPGSRREGSHSNGGP